MEKTVNEVKRIVKEASRIMLKRDFTVSIKSDESNIVTSADIAVQKFLAEQLTGILPNSIFLGEEGKLPDELTDGSNATEDTYIWVNDPIDGTANYARDMGLSVISVALLKGKTQMIGVVYNPYRDEMFWAIKDKGAFMNDTPIHVSDKPFRTSMLCSAMSLYDKSLAKPCFDIIEKIYDEADDLRRLGTAALELCYLACGKVDLYFEIRLSCWDYAAATLILKEAGGYFDVMFADSVVLDKPAGIIGANTEENFEKIKDIVYGVIPAPLY